MGAITLWQEAKLAKLDPVSRAAQIAIARSTMVFNFLPFISVDDYQWDTTYDTEEARASYRAINEELTEGENDVAKLQFSTAILGDIVSIDRSIIRNKGRQAFSKQMVAKSEGIGFTYNESFIKGSRAADPRQFDGLQTIMENQIPGSQTFASSTSGGEALSLDKLDAAISAVRGAGIIFCSDNIFRKFWSAGRNSAVSGFVNYQPNDANPSGMGLGAQIVFYGGIPIVPIKSTFNEDTILPFDEPASVGGAAQTTSLYIAKLGADGLYGAQNGSIMANDFGQVQGSVYHKGDVEWEAGVGVDHPLAVCRYKDITDEAFVS